MARNNFIPRIFAKNFVDGQIQLDESEFFYIKTLRISEGSIVEVFVRDNEIYCGKIAKINQDFLVLEDIERLVTLLDEKLQIHLAFSVSSKEATRDALDFATQANVASITPYISDMSDRKTQLFLDKKGAKIVLEATRQSRRKTIVTLNETTDYAGVAVYFIDKNVEKIIIADVHSPTPEKSFFDSNIYGLMIGPESGLTEHDIESMQAAMSKFDVAVYSFSTSTMKVQTACAAIPSYIRGVYGAING